MLPRIIPVYRIVIILYYIINTPLPPRIISVCRIIIILYFIIQYKGLYTHPILSGSNVTSSACTE